MQYPQTSEYVIGSPGTEVTDISESPLSIKISTYTLWRIASVSCKVAHSFYLTTREAEAGGSLLVQG